MNYIIQKDKSKLVLAQYLHACAFLPKILTFQECINRGNFITWPGIDDVKLKRLLHKPLATSLGHLDQEQKGLQSTEVNMEEDSFPEKITQKTMNCFYIITDILTKSTTYTDQTGRISCQSSRGNNYFFICYNYNANAILPERSRIEKSILLLQHGENVTHV